MPQNIQIQRLQLSALKLIHGLTLQIKTKKTQNFNELENELGKDLTNLSLDKYLNDIQKGNNVGRFLIGLDTQTKLLVLQETFKRICKKGEYLFSDQQINSLRQAHEQGHPLNDAFEKNIESMSYIKKNILFNCFNLINSPIFKDCWYDFGSGEKKPFRICFFRLFCGEKLDIDLGKPLFDYLSTLVDAETSSLKMPEPYLQSTNYKHQVASNGAGRFHFFNVSSDGLTADALKGLKGDYLKSQILLAYKKDIESCKSEADLNKCVELIKSEPKYQLLKKSQGLTTWALGLETSSIKAFQTMVAKQRTNIQILQIRTPSL